MHKPQLHNVMEFWPELYVKFKTKRPEFKHSILKCRGYGYIDAGEKNVNVLEVSVKVRDLDWVENIAHHHNTSHL